MIEYSRLSYVNNKNYKFEVYVIKNQVNELEKKYRTILCTLFYIYTILEKRLKKLSTFIYC